MFAPRVQRLAPLALALALGCALPALAKGKASVTYLHALADAGGKLAFSWPSLTWDAKHRELYVVDLTANVVHVFNDNGMAEFAFGDHPAFGLIRGVAVLPNGELLVLSTRSNGNNEWFVTRCNYRGEPIGRFEPRGVPAELLREFSPDEITVVQERVYLADKAGMRVVLTALDGEYVRGFDFAATIADGYVPGMRGFSVDPRGNMLFTVSTQFRAFIVAPDGGMRTFGVKGSTPGKFNVVSGIAADEEGNVYVADSLRAVVMVFDRHLGFVTEIGGGITAPLEIVQGNGRVYVTQSLGGVKAYAVHLE